MSADTLPLIRWSAKVDGQPQAGTVEAPSPRLAAQAWAEFIDLRDEECEIEVLAEGSDTPHWFTVEAETTYTVLKSEGPPYDSGGTPGGAS